METGKTDDKFDVKYRCKDFSDIIGNKTVIKTLEKIVKKRSVKTFMLHGPRGCGKTTLGRIMANHLGVKSPEDYQEIDLGRAGKKDTAIELEQLTRLMSLSGGSKVLLLDEVQSANKFFFEAMLKVLEEPKGKTYFILCTTNPGKILTTIKSRCMQFKVGLLKQDESKVLIERVCKKEGIKLPSRIKAKLIKKTDGCPREILTLLQLLSDADDQEEMQILISGMSSTDEESIIKICRMIMKCDYEISDLLLEGNFEIESARGAVLNYFNTVNLKKYDQRYSDIHALFSEPFYNSGRSGFNDACLIAVRI